MLLHSSIPARHVAAPPFTPNSKTNRTHFHFSNFSSFKPPKCSLSAVSEAPHFELSTHSNKKPFPAEVSRTIMELATVGTLSALTNEGHEGSSSPLAIGVRFTVDPHEGTPFFFLNPTFPFSPQTPSSLHVQLNQSGLRTPQCTLQGTLTKPQDTSATKRLVSLWGKRFGEEVDQDLMYIVAVDRVLQLEDFQEDGEWISSLDYKNAQPDPLRQFAEKLVSEINTNNMEDIIRFCNVYVDLDFQVLEAKMIWVDRLGFDMRLLSTQKGIFEVRIPFPGEVTDEKGAKSTFNCMSQLAWEVERNFQPLDFEKVKQLKHIKS
ncbi:hypothetical protein HN51_026690 [Arachis hypogaea]|uniref:DUF2470 domain-containing protein n=1 Tax=Arachis hypogaea TaxID=3818 RepID=A0A445BQT1_ARAHY|nr:glutamyl-tRNA reductase-binding protein, chloroplastic [Arachis hypogaea]RYR41006.1 hypothetical protein Ahy_A09g046747 [Arachis hypogaea]